MEKAFVMTMRASDSGPVPAEFGESYVMTCDRCGAKVYTTSTTYERMHEEGIDQHEIVCNVCALPILEEELEKLGSGEEEELVAGDPTFQPVIDGHEREFLEWMIARAKGEAGPLR